MSRPPPASRALVAGMLAFIFACSRDSDSTATSASRLLSIDSIPLVDIGDEADGPHAEFSGFLQSALHSDGRIVVANGGSQELRVFDSTGAWLQTIGRRGAGPGEFESLGWLDVGVGDTLRMYDWSLLRISVFSPGGVYQRGVTMGKGGGVGLRPHVVLANGEFVVSTQKLIDMSLQSGVRRDTSTLILYDANGIFLDSLGHFPGGEAWITRTARSVRSELHTAAPKRSRLKNATFCVILVSETAVRSRLAALLTRRDCVLSGAARHRRLTPPARVALRAATGGSGAWTR